MATLAGHVNSNTQTCSVCASAIPFGPNTSFRVGPGDVCFPCLKGPMDLLTTTQASYPCIVNGVPLDPGMFPAVLFGGEEAYEKYKNLFDMKKTEWATPTTIRLYCNCPVGRDAINQCTALIGSSVQCTGSCGLH